MQLPAKFYLPVKCEGLINICEHQKKVKKITDLSTCNSVSDSNLCLEYGQEAVLYEPASSGTWHY